MPLGARWLNDLSLPSQVRGTQTEVEGKLRKAIGNVGMLIEEKYEETSHQIGGLQQTVNVELTTKISDLNTGINERLTTLQVDTRPLGPIALQPCQNPAHSPAPQSPPPPNLHA